MHRFPPRGLTVAQQYYSLRFSSHFANGSGSVRRNALRWRIEVAPSPLSRLYKLELSYRPPAAPIVHVISPNLVDLAGGRRLPHVYEQTPSKLCLYLPG